MLAHGRRAKAAKAAGDMDTFRREATAYKEIKTRLSSAGVGGGSTASAAQASAIWCKTSASSYPTPLDVGGSLSQFKFR